MFKAQCVTVRNPFHPQRGREIRTLDFAGPISALAPETKQPFIILRNGQAVLRADWDQPVADGDLMAVVLLPQGDDGGSDVLRIVLMIVVIVVAWYAGPYVGAALGMSSSAGTAIVGLAGSVLVNAILPSPTAAGFGGSGVDSKLASPTYNISAQGNTARLGGAIPIQYGRLNVYPDFAAAPYVEYEGNEQYLYELLCIGVGEYEIEQIRIEDSDISNFEEITYEVVGPNEPLDLFPAAVSTSGEVSGQEMLYDTEIGPFVANNAGTLATRIAVDVVCPRGLYYANDNASLVEKSITFTVSSREVDDDGVAVGSWVVLGNETITAATSTPQRHTFTYAMSSSRYEVKVKRTDEKDVSNRAGHEIIWSGLRAHLVSDATFGNVTLLALKMRATNNLSAQASRKVNVTCTRKLYHWNGDTWLGTTATRNPAWALADACHTVGLPDNRIDLDALVDLAATWTARGDRFDGRFDSTSTFWESVTKIAQAGRAKPYMQGGIVHFMRDQAKTLPVALYSMRNIVRGSFSINFMTPTDDTADAVEVTYFDESTWKPRTLSCKLPDSSALKPAKVELFGVVNREQAYREGMYMAAANRRRTFFKLSTEMEGFIPSYGDLVAVNHDLPQWGQHAEAVAWDDETRKLTLSEPMTWGSGTHYIGLRRRDGSVSGPYAVSSKNLLSYTEQIDGPAWGLIGPMLITPNAAVSPEGENTADRVHQSAAFGSVYQDVDVAGTQALTGSIFVKSDGSTDLTFTLYWFVGGATQNVGVRFNPATGSFIASGYTTDFIGYSITAEGNGYYRVSVSGRGTDSANTKCRFQIYDNSPAAGAFYLWGAQLESGSALSEYEKKTDAPSSSKALVLSTNPDFTPYAGQDEERTHVVFGWGETWRQLALVISVRPKDEYTVEMTCVNEDASVHTADMGITAPATISSQLPATPASPVIRGLSIRSMPDAPGDMLGTWQPAAGAEYYVVEQSADGRSWTRTAETRTNNFTAKALYGSQTIVRVAAVGSVRGAWVTSNYAVTADYMWSADDSTLMWSSDSNLMWRY